ncbi:MAG: ParB/RepB/Spo0J family partition protein [Aphanocapsa sp. GSE-SYN-MK-11-07L]|jgi:ParB/RepB/Spo0J family partition protein|nr:ParB/RepB/Spo0J family partition protein [Aphanocapsa sp. GSE-SYN-MK-11-07L]
MTEQLSLIPEKLATPKQRKVVLTELPDNEELLGDDPNPAFIDSIRQFGFLHPIGLVESDTGYQVAFGRRRIKAARLLELISIPASIFPQGWTPVSVLTLIENKHRSDNLGAKLDAIDALRKRATPEEICAAVGITQPQLSKAITLLDQLTPQLQMAVKEGRMTTSTAKKAAKLPEDQQQELAHQDKITAKAVDQYLKVQAMEQADNLPAELFEGVPEKTWQAQAQPLIEQLLTLIPQDEELRLHIEQLAEGLKAKH